MRTLNAVLIDPETRTTKAVSIDVPKDGNTLKPFYDLIGCRLCEIINIGYSLRLVIDEEGLLSSNHHFNIPGVGRAPIAGKAVLLPSDDAGEFMSLPADLTPERIACRIDWLGDDNGLEEAILAGDVDRPVTTFATSFEPDAKREILWQWSPNS